MFRRYADSRAFFEAIRRAAPEIEYWHMVEREGAEALAAPSHDGGAHGIGDPTANRAVWLADNDGAVRARARREIARRTELVGAGLVAIAAVRDGLGAKYADALDAHYIDGDSYRDIAEAQGVSRKTVMLRVSVACDWCDSQPLAHLFG